MIVLAYVHTVERGRRKEHWLHMRITPLNVPQEGERRAWQRCASFDPLAMGTKLAIEEGLRERFSPHPHPLVAWTSAEVRDEWALPSVGH